MNHLSFAQRLCLSVVLFFSFNTHALTPVEYNDGDISVKLTGMYRPESFWGRNVNLLNDCNKFDRLFWARHTLDMGMHLGYGYKTYGEEVFAFDMSWRNKARWGDASSIASTTQTETRALDELGREHKHAFPRLISWVREMWLEFDIARSVGLVLPTNPKFKLGAFPFVLGRGIALGAAYAVGPEFLGFYSDAAIDQFAFGAKISDTFIKDVLDFDFYVGLLQNKSGSVSQTGALIAAQQYGRRDMPERGPYKINFAVASRFKWKVFNSPTYGKFELEPYGVFNHDPEQRVEFTADAESKLLTLGLAGEYNSNRFELGFDYAVNLGHQFVKGWDRNHNQLENRNGLPTVVNSHVLANINPGDTAQVANNDVTKFKAINARNTVDSSPQLQNYGKTVQGIIDSSEQSQQFNSAQLASSTTSGVSGYTDAVKAPIATNGATPPVVIAAQKDTLYNAANRFRDPYKNEYEGWMAVGDAAFWLIPKELRLAVTGGIASGDANPNEVNMDNSYGGFIPLQEFYVGKRVPSVFLLGSGSRLSRPLSQPRNNLQAPNKFASVVNGFSNIILAGGGLQWQPASSERKVRVRPNILGFWQHFPGVKFDATTGKDLNELAASYLGLELNLFFDYMMFENTKFFIVASVFVPGKHFSDIKGRPINSDQERRLNRFNRTSIVGTPIPNIGDNPAFTFNVGMEINF